MAIDENKFKNIKQGNHHIMQKILSDIGFSIVICTHNGLSRLDPTLTQIAALKIPAGYAVEVVLVDNASTDGTAAFTEQVWQKIGASFPLHVIYEGRPGKGYAVETGFDAANYSLLLTVDDDNWLDNYYLIKSVELLNTYPDVGALQGTSEAVLETPAPAWFSDPRMAKQLVVGGQQEHSGYLPADQFHVWGAGLVTYRQDWLTLRELGFSFLTSKVPGKAAGEDSELGLGLWLLGRRIYYSEELRFKHFMPAGRLEWAKLRQNFRVFGYVSYYFGLYAAVIAALQRGEEPNAKVVRNSVLSGAWQQLRLMTAKQHLAYWVKPQEQYYQLLLAEYYNRLYWLHKLTPTLPSDLCQIRRWVEPLLQAQAVQASEAKLSGSV
jgi:glycosyltransferase involved in cell wall biosynthesis